jgi:hypothetical protein
MELAAGDEISHADITARIPEVWAAEIEARAEIERVFKNIVRLTPTSLVALVTLLRFQDAHM